MNELTLSECSNINVNIRMNKKSKIRMYKKYSYVT